MDDDFIRAFGAAKQGKIMCFALILKSH